MTSRDAMTPNTRRQFLIATAGVGVCSVTRLGLGQATSPDDKLNIVGDVTLVGDGRPGTTIVLPRDPTPAEQRGARELRDHLKEMSGAGLEIVQATTAGSRTW